MPASKLRAIIFDIGRVLVRIDVSRAMEGLAAGSSLSPAEIWTSLEKDPRWPDWQEGRIAPHDWYLYVTKRFNREMTFEQFTEIWNRVLDPNPIQEDAFIAGLSKRYRLSLL